MNINSAGEMIPVNLELVNELWLPNIFIYNLKTFKVGLMTMQDFQGRTFKTFKVGLMTMQDGTRIAAPNTYHMDIGNMVTITWGHLLFYRSRQQHQRGSLIAPKATKVTLSCYVSC